MKDREKAKGELINELNQLKKRIITPEKSREDEVKYRTIFENIQDIYYRADNEGNILMINCNGAKELGYNSPDEVIGKNIADDFYLNPEERKRNLNKVKESGGTIQGMEIDLKKKDGTPIIVTSASHFLYDKEGQIVGIEGLLVNVTEKRKTEEALHKSHEEFVSLFQYSPLAAMYHDEKGNVLSINSKFTELFGYTLNEIKGKNIHERKIFLDIDTVKESVYLTRLALEGKDVKYETIRKKKDGTPLSIIITVAPVIRKGECRAVIAFYQDITEQKKVQNKLQESEEKYRTLFENTPAVYCQSDKEGNILMINPAGVALLGYNSPEEIIGKNLTYDIYCNPKERFTFLEVMKKNQGSIRDYEVTLKKKDGTPIVVLTNSQYYYNKDGALSGVVGIFVDITERKKNENALHKSQQEFASLFKSSPEALVYIDGDSNILDINPRFTELFGYTSEEAKGRNINDGMIHPQNKIREAKDLYQKSLSGNYYNYETVRKKKDRSYFPVGISSSTVFIDGQPKGRIVSYMDITETKRNELIQQVLYNISNAANSIISFESLYGIIHRQLSKLIDTTNFYIALLDREKEEIYFPYSVDEMQRIHHSRSIGHNSLIAYIFNTGEPVLVNKEIINKNEVFKKYEQWFGKLRHTWLGVPLKIKEETIGALVVQSYRDPEQYSKNDIKILEIISSQISVAIKRKQDEEALRKSQHEFASLFQSHSEALLYVDEHGTILDLNKRFIQVFGYTPEEIKGKNINCGIIHPPDKVNEGEELDKKALAQGYVRFETMRRKKDGTIFPVSISGSPVIINGKARGIIGTYIDITERKQLENQLGKMARIDNLTNCYNRRYGLDLLDRQIKLSKRNKTPLLVSFVDIDNFKEINDTFGHCEGDQILKEVASLFNSTLREADIICRMGGDEFLLVFPDSSLKEVPLIKKRMQKNLAQLNKRINKNYIINFSMGFSEYLTDKPESLDILIGIADKRMYEDKKRNKK